VPIRGQVQHAGACAGAGQQLVLAIFDSSWAECALDKMFTNQNHAASATNLDEQSHFVVWQKNYYYLKPQYISSPLDY